MTSRTLQLNSRPNTDGSCVLYVMSRDQRVNDNHALLEAQTEAIAHSLPLLVVFNLLPSTGYRKREHYEFMVAGLKEVQNDLSKLNIPFIVTIGSMTSSIRDVVKDYCPRSIYFDFSPLNGPRSAQKTIAAEVQYAVSVIDTHNVVPAWVVSDKEEYAAHTIRRKLHKTIEQWAVEPESLLKHPHSFDSAPKGQTWSEVEKIVRAMPSNGINHGFQPGEAAAIKALGDFISHRLAQYASNRNDPIRKGQSDLSPYLHYGQLSSLRILIEVMKSSTHRPHLFDSFTMPSHEGDANLSDSINSFVEELIVRKELSDNFCLYASSYDTLDAAKDWAKKTLTDHRDDPREHIYTKEQLESAQTHDELWNAAQRQLRASGKIHGYMRMYWAKKILEWTNTPETALKWTIELNDTYHLDGGDPNGYVGILWSIAGVHDRPWFNRSVYGTIRYMSTNGLKNKFDTKRYIEQWSN